MGDNLKVSLMEAVAIGIRQTVKEQLQPVRAEIQSCQQRLENMADITERQKLLEKKWTS